MTNREKQTNQADQTERQSSRDDPALVNLPADTPPDTGEIHEPSDAVTPSKEKSRETFIQAVKFTLLSLSAGGIEAGSFFLLNLLTPWSYAAKHVISIVLSVLWNFTLNRHFTFKSANNVPIAMIKVGLFYLIFIPVSGWLGQLAADSGISETIIKIATMLMNFIGEFLWWKFVVFRGSENTNKLARKQQLKKQMEEPRHR
ncbi:MAG TPA: GtrA family protein [Bacillota bacterium]|nr:GtrA family protein [Bacillota bacterium]